MKRFAKLSALICAVVSLSLLSACSTSAVDDEGEEEESEVQTLTIEDDEYYNSQHLNIYKFLFSLI